MNPNAGPTYQGLDLTGTAGRFGLLTPTFHAMEDRKVLQDRMREDGYLYLPGLLDPQRIQAARLSLFRMLAEQGILDTAYPLEDGVARVDPARGVDVGWANGHPAVDALLYEADMMSFWEFFLDEPVLHFDFTWLRARTPGEVTVTPPHCDTVFMGRGTPNLFTAWTPLVNVPYELGGLMILEHSHRRGDLLGDYWKMDVDTYCTNGPEAADIESGHRNWQSDKHNGQYTEDAIGLHQTFQSRWLGAEYQVGDVLVFGMHTLHAAADNRTNRIRLSTDSRYQRASEPADERWIGAHPKGHGVHGKIGMIC